MRALSRHLASRLVLLWLALPVGVFGTTPQSAFEPETLESSPEVGDPFPGVTTAGDTLWIADWSFDAGGRCTDAGWARYDNRIVNDGSNYWSVSPTYAGTGSITGNAAVLRKHDLTWARDGYGNNWDYAIVLKYRGASTLSFDFVSDTEPDFDFVQVEADSAGASETRVNYATNPGATAASYRSVLFTVDGPQANGHVAGLPLPDFGDSATVHAVYIRLTSDGGSSDEDGEYPSAFNAGLVVDNVTVTGSLAYTEGFECGWLECLNPNVRFVNSAPSTPFGLWARLWPHPTDNDVCAEDKTCAWIFTDPSLPAYSSDMAFGPRGTVVRNWLDNVIVSPWVSLSGLPPASATLLSFRRFPGSSFANGNIVQGWRVRSRVRIDNTDTSTPGDSIEVATMWAHAASWSSLSSFKWQTSIADMSPYIPTGAREIQVSFRVSDWQLVAGAAPPATLGPGPGPYLDRVRIGRRGIPGPKMDSYFASRNVAQDGFPSTEIAACPRIAPTEDRFGSSDFSSSFVNPYCRYSIPEPVSCYGLEDSITMNVQDVRGVGITGVGIYAAIVSGPHAGKAPPPWSVGANGLFLVQGERTHSESIWSVDLDDQYFRGGDRLVYFWWATDAAGGFTSAPPGLNAIPSSIEEAQQATGGLLEVAFLPRIDWDPAYLARIAGHPSGKIDPTPQEIANSRQATSILYVRQRREPRRSGTAHRSLFMHTLDELGYGTLYDEFYINCGGVTYLHHLESRASVAQATGYALIIQDSGAMDYGTIPNGGCARETPVDQIQWYRDWLAQVATSQVSMRTLWILGTNVAAAPNWMQAAPNAFIAQDMGVTLVNATQSLLPYPLVVGQRVFTLANGDSIEFTGDAITLKSTSCANIGNDALGSTGTAVVTHRYTLGASVGEGAAVMKANPAERWNTIMMSFAWEDLFDPFGTVPGDRQAEWLDKILSGVLPDSIRALAHPTDAAERVAGLPRVTALHQNVPNPFNPTTTIRFDLAQGGKVRLRIYDVAGRRVRTLIDKDMQIGRNHTVAWNGLDDQNGRVASGVYFYRLDSPDASLTRKLVVMK